MDTRIKERLVGAIALVAIVVIVVPELLTGPRAPVPPRASPAGAPVHTVSIDLAAGERGTIARPPSTPSAPSAAAAPAPSNERGSEAAAAADESQQAAAGAPAAAPVAPAPAGAATPREPAPSAPAGPASPRARETAHAPPVAAAHAPAAPSAPAPPASAAPRPAAAAGSAEGWVVQLGSFASRDNAEGLAKGLRAKGYRAFVAEFHGSGRVLYRVRVGPEQDRARAEAIAARLAREGHRGSIAPQP